MYFTTPLEKLDFFKYGVEFYHIYRNTKKVGQIRLIKMVESIFMQKEMITLKGFFRYYLKKIIFL
jgi:hypothetical protein